MADATNTSPASIGLSPACAALFLAYWKDAGNWSGTPCVGGNVKSSQENNGYITDLKKKGLLTTFSYDGDRWIEFTEAGRAMFRECRDCNKDIFAGQPWNRCEECARRA